MRVLMFGWEFPPVISGGLGVASEGLVRGLLRAGTEVVLVLPRHPFASPHRGLEIIDAAEVGRHDNPPHRKRFLLRLRRIPSLLRPYTTELEYAQEREVAERTHTTFVGHYGPDLATEVLRYAELAGRIARRERFDVIHAHDWLTYLAGLEARRASGHPLVVHVHATEFDRALDGGNPVVADIERLGPARAGPGIGLSGHTAQRVATFYGVSAERIRVVHNAIDPKETVGDWEVGETDPLVLFAGRVTWQKGPEDFVEAARRVAGEIPNVRFAVAGSGDRMPAM